MGVFIGIAVSFGLAGLAWFALRGRTVESNDDDVRRGPPASPAEEALSAALDKPIQPTRQLSFLRDYERSITLADDGPTGGSRVQRAHALIDALLAHAQTREPSAVEEVRSMAAKNWKPRKALTVPKALKLTKKALKGIPFPLELTVTREGQTVEVSWADTDHSNQDGDCPTELVALALSQSIPELTFREMEQAHKHLAGGCGITAKALKVVGSKGLSAAAQAETKWLQEELEQLNYELQLAWDEMSDASADFDVQKVAYQSVSLQHVAIVEQLIDWVAEVVDELRDFHDSKTEKWQDGENGQAFSELLDDWDNLEVESVRLPAVPALRMEWKPWDVDDLLHWQDTLVDTRLTVDD